MEQLVSHESKTNAHGESQHALADGHFSRYLPANFERKNQIDFLP
jgi:hypothetical protein